MSLFIETIKFKDGKLFNLDYHNKRFRRTRREFFAIDQQAGLEEYISIPALPDQILFKCRVVYGKSIEKVEFLAYDRRIISSLKVIIDNDIDYSFKYAGRENLEQLYNQKGECDDILIVKNNIVTDSFLANVVFWDGTVWLTPSTPLLKGIQRAFLLDINAIEERKIESGDIFSFKKIRLINALNSLDDAPDININNIIF